MIRALAAAAVFHGGSRLLIEDDAEEEDKGTLEVGQQEKRRGGVRKMSEVDPSDWFQRGVEDSPAHS